MMLSQDTIGRYRMIRRLGAGSFATVWLAHDDDLDIDVAVKVLAENWSCSDDIRDRFLAEARIMRRVRDPRIVSVHDLGVLPDGRPYFVMDFCNAGSLKELRERPIDPINTLQLCAQAARALQVLHDHGVVHRDVTPGNLLLDRAPDGTVSVHLADLGVAKSMIDLAQMTATAGTPAYMAPEQARGQRLDHRADLYALGSVMYAVLAGRTPFEVASVQDLVTRPIDVRPAPLAQQLNMPPELDMLLNACLSVDPAQRPPSAAEIARQLDALIALAQMGPQAAQMVPFANFAPTALPPTHPSAVSAASVVQPNPNLHGWRFWAAMGTLSVVLFCLTFWIVLMLV